MGRNSQVQESQRVSYRLNLKRNMPRHILIKLTKIKHKKTNIKSSKGRRTNIIQEDPHKANSLQQKLCRPQGDSWIYLKWGKGKTYNQGYSIQKRSHSVSFIVKGKIKSFINKQKLREFSTTKPVLQQMLKELL